MTNVRNELSEFIRRVDGGNKLSPAELGYEIALWSSVLPRPLRRDSADVIGFVKRFNPDKVLGAGALADAIVDEFHLDEDAS